MSANAENNAGASSLKVATILVNWRQPQRTLEAVYAVTAQTESSIIIVVDNGSNDDSVDYLQKLLPSDVKLVIRDMNGGFGAGVNEGLKEVYKYGAKYAWLLNNDAIPERNCLEKLVSVAENDPAIGVVGARIIDPSGSVPDHAGTVMNERNFNCTYSMSPEDMNSARFAWVTGACMLLNVNALREIGEFDTRFFMYWEDADLSCRLKNAGYGIGVASEAVITHQAGTSSNEIQLRRYEWHIHSQSLWVEKHFYPKAWGITIIYARNLIRSVLNMDWDRFSLTVRCICS